jgi:hypothetical protein
VADEASNLFLQEDGILRIVVAEGQRSAPLPLRLPPTQWLGKLRFRPDAIRPWPHSTDKRRQAPTPLHLDTGCLPNAILERLGSHTHDELRNLPKRQANLPTGRLPPLALHCSAPPLGRKRVLQSVTHSTKPGTQEAARAGRAHKLSLTNPNGAPWREERRGLRAG